MYLQRSAYTRHRNVRYLIVDVSTATSATVHGQNTQIASCCCWFGRYRKFGHDSRVKHENGRVLLVCYSCAAEFHSLVVALPEHAIDGGTVFHSENKKYDVHTEEDCKTLA